jgi:hypothetical protein
MLMSTPMVIATENRIKNQTRRLSGLDPVNVAPDKWSPEGPMTVNEKGKLIQKFRCDNSYKYWVICECPYGQLGDILWIRESFYQVGKWLRAYPEDDEFSMWNSSGIYHYVADGVPTVMGENDWGVPIGTEGQNGFIPYKGDNIWRKCPSIHMPLKVCRIFLRITDIRIERLQDITEEDAKAEGIEYIVSDMVNGYRYYGSKPSSIIEAITNSPIESFRSLWESINGQGSWDANPFIWRVSFERIDKPV